MRLYFSYALLLGGLLVLSGCPKAIPTQQLKDAKDAIDKASKGLAERCAKEEMASAKRMMAKAKKLMDEGKYDQAKIAFEATRELAAKAEEAARLNKDECLKRKNPVAAKPPSPPTVVPVKESPVIDTRRKLTTVYFAFNAYTITGNARRILQGHAEWLKQNSTVKIEVAGHCDQRGSVEYNLSLGERRALAVKKFLVDLGVSPNRISIISYGHQRPADPRQTPEAYAKNRRAEFRATR
ncbi:MAG: DUF4398 domain-containing protein [Deltaproteobacteria bacterium]|nr:MAG: DUF4398 domain-containing protein [Deltaproteobacteria bacterium]